jgi:hypothetical protein
MPAIQPARLKLQIANLVVKYQTPKVFLAELKDLFDIYSDRTKTTSTGKPRNSLNPSYNVPTQVTKQLERALKPLLTKDSENALALADILWEEKWLECRQLALALLCWQPDLPSENIQNRIKRWGEESRNNRQISESLANVLLALGKKSTETIFDLLKYWLFTSDFDTRKLSYWIIGSLVSDSRFKHLPNIYKLLTPHIQSVNQVPDPDLVEAIRCLARKSPKETAYYLRRNLALSDNPGLYALIRKCLDAFPQAIQKELLSYLHQQREELDNI